MKAKKVKDFIKESGAGYAVWGGGSRGGFGNPSTSTGRFYGRGFGFGSQNSGGPNLMYTYDIKPLNRTLEPPVSDQIDHQDIHVGSVIKGKVLGRDKHIIGQVLRVEEDHEGNIKWYLVLDPETSTKMKLDPTSSYIWEPQPEGGMDSLSGIKQGIPTVENYNINSFTKGKTSKESLKIGESRYKAIKMLLDKISNDLMGDDTLEGFINLSADGFNSSLYKTAFMDFVEDYNSDPNRKNYWDEYLKNIGLEIGGYPDEDETIFILL